MVHHLFDVSCDPGVDGIEQVPESLPPQGCGRRPCPYRELDPTVFVVKPAEDRPGNDFAEPLDRTRMWRILCQSEMCSDLVVVAGIGLQDPAQVGLAEDDDVIEAFPADRAK
jgi:hypothetical protein